MEKFTEETQRSGLRPQSAKVNELQALKSSKSRSISSANKQIMKRIKLRAENSKAKHSKVPYSREELYDQNMLVKHQMNQLKDENLKLKTKVKILEKENKKEETESDKGHLVTNLKIQIKDLQKQLETKDHEITEMKKNSKHTKLQEIEVEMKMYIDECTRLRRMLEEAMQQLFGGQYAYDLQEKYIQQSIQLKNVKRDFQNLSMVNEEIRNPDSRYRKKEKLIKLKRSLVEMREEINKLRDENQNLNRMLNEKCPHCNMNQEAARGPQEIVWDIWQAIEHRRLTPQTTCQLINLSENQMSLDEFNLNLEKLGIFLTPQEITNLSELTNSTTISQSQFLNLLSSQKPTQLVTYSDVKETLQHFSFRLQIKRWTLDQVPHIFFQEPRFYSQQEFYTMLHDEPVELNDQQAELLSRYLFGSAEMIPAEEGIARIFDFLENWEVLNEDKEVQFDRKLREILQEKSSEIKEKCEELDTEKKGVLQLEEFKKVWKEIGLEVEDELWNYLELLFYTDQFLLDCVPYVNFLQAYSSEERAS